MAKGLKSLHDLSILHRDLKSANIFLNRDGTLKMGDLNVSKVAKYGGLLFTQTGTPYYASPEVWKDQPYDFKSDIWSLGCILYEMCSLKHPFEAKNQADLLLKIVKGKYESIPKKFSKELGELVHSCLMKDYNRRPSIEDIVLH